MECDHHLVSGPNCGKTADVPSFYRRTALSSMPFWSRIDEVLKCGDSMIWHHMLFSAFYSVVPQPSCANEQLSPNLHPDSDSQNWHSRRCHNHKGIWCRNLWSNLCTAVERTSQMDSGLRGSFSSMHFYLLVLVVQRVVRFVVSVFARS